MIKDLFKLANRLDKLGLRKEADVLDSAIRKLSQTTAQTIGNEGSDYYKGRERPGTPGTTVKFYASTPKSITDFNKFLAGLIRDAIKNPYQSIFSASVKRSIASLESQTSWSDVTNAAFRDYAIAAGKPEAGRDWPAFAKAHRYAPSLAGVYAFWKDTIDGVVKTIDIGKKEDGVSPDYDAPAVATTPVAAESPAATGAKMASPLEWNREHLWLKGTFVDASGNNLWHISENDKERMRSLFANDPAVQNLITPLMNQPARDNGESNTKFDTIIQEWYRRTLKEQQIKGWYKSDSEGPGEIVPINSTVPSPARTKVTTSSYNSMIKGMISR